MSATIFWVRLEVFLSLSSSAGTNDNVLGVFFHKHCNHPDAYPQIVVLLCLNFWWGLPVCMYQSCIARAVHAINACLQVRPFTTSVPRPLSCRCKILHPTKDVASAGWGLIDGSLSGWGAGGRYHDCSGGLCLVQAVELHQREEASSTSTA